MCNRFRNTLGWTDIYEDFSDLKIPLVFPQLAPNLEPRPDIRPTNPAPVIRAMDPANPSAGVGLFELRWWLVPFFHKKTLKEWKPMCTNARSETVAATAAFREPFKRRRCLVPANGFYEWTGDKTPKTKWMIEQVGQPWFCMAGLWDRAETADGPIESFTILTTAAGADMGAIHSRQPVILDRADWARWLDLTAPVDDLFSARPAGALVISPAPEEAVI